MRKLKNKLIGWYKAVTGFSLYQLGKRSYYKRMYRGRLSKIEAVATAYYLYKVTTSGLPLK